MEFIFNQALYRTEDLLKIIPIPRCSLFKLRDEWIAKGGNTRALGLVKLAGSDLNYWEGPKFLEWLYKQKVINPEVKVLVIKSRKGKDHATT